LILQKHPLFVTVKAVVAVTVEVTANVLLTPSIMFEAVVEPVSYSAIDLAPPGLAAVMVYVCDPGVIAS